MPTKGTIRRTEDGTAMWNPEFGPPIHKATRKCVHCGLHVLCEKGSGKVRGWCDRCNGFVCGPACFECVPEEQMLENIENGRLWNYRPIVASVPDMKLS